MLGLGAGAGQGLGAGAGQGLGTGAGQGLGAAAGLPCHLGIVPAVLNKELQAELLYKKKL